MDPNSSPWAYAYNRIVPSASGSSDDFQHTHLAQISAAAGSSAQSLLLQAAHSSIAGFNATSGNFVPPTPIGGYNPVFQQIYHHAAQAAVQPKPAHYASSAVSTSHRHLGLSGTVEKQDICRSQPAALGYTTNQSINIPTSSYYGENSSSSGASPSPTTSATSSTTLSWNTPVIGTPQQMSANTFLTMHQQQQQSQQQATINQVEKVINSKQSNLQIQMKGHSKNYEDLIYVGNHQQEHEENTLQLDNQIIQAVSEEDCARSEEGFYTFVDGKLSYNIPAAAISSASLPNKMPVSSIKVVTPRKHSSSESHHPTLQQGLRQIPSPAYPIYESPSLCSSVGSPPPAVNSVHNNESANNSSHNNVYKSNTPTQQAQTSLDVSNVGRGANSNNNRNNSFARNSVSNSSLSPTTNVGYSSVITSAFQAQQQQQLQQEHHQMQQSVCWPGSSTNKLSDISKHDQKVYSIHSPHAQENNIYILPPSLQIKRTIIETVQQTSELPQASPQVNQQMVENTLHVMSSQRDAAKHQPRNQLQPTEPQQLVQSKQQHSVENVLATNNTQASQIQNTTKVEEVQKPIPTKKAPRKRQPKKTLLQNNDFSRTSQQNNQTLQQPSRQQQQQQQIQHHQPQQQQQQQVQQQQQQQHNSSFYDYNNRWMQPKVENNINIPSFGNNQSQQTNPVPQPAHVQSSQTHPHISQISQYYPAFPQHVSTQYAACMSQNTNLYNLTPLGQDAQQEHQQQQNVHQNAQDTLQQQNTSEEVQTEPAAESSSCKVIVPNIEDELHFLTTSDPKVSAKVQNNSLYGRDSTNLKTTQQKPSSDATNTYPPFEKKDGPGKKSAFMDSYLKFLQGERDESPPPLMKTGRKYNYQKPCMQKEYVNSNKRKSNDNSHSSNTSSVTNTENTSSAAEGSAVPTTNNEGTVTGSDDGHKIKIISQTQILPKKRPQAQNMAAVIQQNPANSEEAPQQHQVQQQQLRVSQQQHSQQYRQIQPQTQNFHQDPLALPPRREQSLRKAKARGINEIMQATPAVTDRDEPEEFADSDADPVWTPQDDDSEDGMPGNFVGKRKNRRMKPNPCSKKKDCSTIKDDSALENDNVNKMALASSTSNNISENTSGNAADNFKTGDFIVLRSDLVNDWPIIWQVDSKCILQKYESFCQNGKMFYRNMSKYASWNLDTKKLYIKAPVRIQVQSHTETIVEFMRSELLADDTEQFIEKIMEDYLTYRDHFEIYIQTMISQVLDPSFFSEINREKDEYFLSSVRTIDEIMENCKRKLLSITPWTRSVIVSIETWPQCHVFTEWGQNNVNQKNCGGCHQPGISVRFLLFGHPYNTNTMQTVPVDMRVAYEKDILLCRICAARADIFHKIAHEKYNLFAICTRRVGEHQKELPGKSSTDILNDLLAENNWVDELFRNMRSSWAEVESLERQKRFHEVSQ